MRIVTVVGARPQFIKAAPLSRVLREYAQEILVHTGQHYDANMSQIFFDELEIPRPDINLGVGSGSHGWQTAQMLEGIEGLLLDEKPDWVLVYGDTNSTLAGALAATKLHIPVAHVEAGLRSYNRHMPEEINRVLTDHASSLLFCPTRQAVENLVEEGILEGVHQVGDVMYDALKYNLQLADTCSNILEKLELTSGLYILATVHRPRNTDDPVRFGGIMSAFSALDYPVIFPMHPRTQKLVKQADLTVPKNVNIVDPVGYLDMLQLEEHADCILTDSGGVQKEAYLLGVRCVTLREETEWVETVESGWNQLVGADPDAIIAAVEAWHPNGERPPYFGDGKASEKIVELLLNEKIASAA
jgi:UDP-N-acetylglucosamine 2-epimerase (non-hydrolysing)/UDP-GlcNAc3NAcA epimerase